MPTAARVVVQPAGRQPLLVEPIVLPDPGPAQVVVRQFASGVCHSQLHQMHAERPTPTVLGHESTGVVIAGGSEVTHVKEGDHVLVTWVPRLPSTRRPQPVALALPGGGEVVSRGVFTWADHTIADEQFVVKIPSDARTDVTSIIACAVMTGAGAVLHTAKVQTGESAAIFGCGGVGLAAVAAARVVGANPIVAVDLDDAKLANAKTFGATHGVNASQTDAVAGVREITGEGADYALDCIGVKVTMEQIVGAVRGRRHGEGPGGTAVLVGVPQVPAELNAMDLLVNEKSFRGSIGGSCVPDRDFPVFLDWFATGKLDLDALVTARYRLEDINEATSALEAGKISGRAILELA